MRKAIIYVRVSTEEQSEKGYSLVHQEERLRNYCKQQNIEVAGFYKEDHSAKTFDRPAFTQLLTFLKKNKKAVDLLLFLKWDRFSRNAGDAYGMINTLHKLGVEPQAMEQPLDLNVPENKIMLAFYLAAPEVENDRRSLNVIAGMRRAMKDGRYCTWAPIGYKNIRTEAGRPIIVPGKDTDLVRWLFEEVAKGENNVKDIWRVAVKKGLKVGRSNMFYLLRNPIYMGKINIPAYKDEEAMQVKGIHEPIISEGLFYDVQNVLDGRKTNHPSVHAAKEELPLRGFLLCCKCGSKLTGSGSKGRGGRYFYYHCNSRCGERYRADELNGDFLTELEKITPKEESITFFDSIVADYYKKAGKAKSINVKEIDDAIEKNKVRITNALRRMSDEEISSADYKEIKNLYEPEIAKLLAKKQELSRVDNNLITYITTAAKVLRTLPDYYQKASLSTKQRVISSIYPEKLTYENKSYRTTRINEAVRLISKPNTAWGVLEKGQVSENGDLSKWVVRLGFEPRLTESESVVLPLHHRTGFSFGVQC
jgi:site-specific DNA recombinase